MADDAQRWDLRARRAFVLVAAAPDPTLGNVAGYAALGGIFFLISALRLGRPTTAH